MNGEKVLPFAGLFLMLLYFLHLCYNILNLSLAAMSACPGEKQKENS